MKRLIVLCLAVFVISCSQNTIKEEGRESAQPQKQQQSEQPAAQMQSTSEKAPVENRIIVPEDVAKKYKSVILSVVDKKSNKDFETEVLIGQKSQVSGTNLSIEVEQYLPDFVMGPDNKITSKSVDDNNPAAKVKVYKGDELVFDGWLFKNFPDIHPFDDEDYSIKLKGSVMK